MPIHEFQCRDCGSKSEFLVGVSAELAQQSITCPSCNSSQLKRLLSPIFIGSSSAAPACGPSGDCGIPGSGMGGCCGGACGGH